MVAAHVFFACRCTRWFNCQRFFNAMHQDGRKAGLCAILVLSCSPGNLDL